MRITFWPPGPTSSASMSEGKVWLTSTSVAVTLLITPLKPETWITEGYGDAGTASAMVITAGLANVPKARAGGTLVARLFATLPSSSLALIETRLVRNDSALGCTTTVTVATWPLTMPPRETVTVPAELVTLPRLVVAEIRVTLSGKTSVSVTPVAGSGPALVIPIE